MRASLRIIYTVVIAVWAVWLMVERHSSRDLERQNKALRERLNQRDGLARENYSLSNLIAEANGLSMHTNLPAPPTLPRSEPDQGFARLRREVQALRLQSKEMEILQANTREVRALAETAAKNARSANSAATANANASQLEVLSASYWTETTNLDVAAELRERIRGDSLKAIASNNLKGDPEFGQPKHLTVVYRFGGLIRTNEFREGDFVVLPPEGGQ
jgi:hypothetical protein